MRRLNYAFPDILCVAVPAVHSLIFACAHILQIVTLLSEGPEHGIEAIRGLQITQLVYAIR